MECAMKLCKENLEIRHIETNITGRVKSAVSLKRKLNWRHRHRKEGLYQDEAAILNDRVDFIGLRIALYFPGDGPKVLDMIQETFWATLIVKFIDGMPWMPLGQPSTNEMETTTMKFIDGKFWTLLGPSSTEQTREASHKRFPGYTADHC
jgi:hypothetical protein